MLPRQCVRCTAAVVTFQARIRALTMMWLDARRIAEDRAGASSLEVLSATSPFAEPEPARAAADPAPAGPSAPASTSEAHATASQHTSALLCTLLSSGSVCFCEGILLWVRWTHPTGISCSLISGESFLPFFRQPMHHFRPALQPSHVVGFSNDKDARDLHATPPTNTAGFALSSRSRHRSLLKCIRGCCSLSKARDPLGGCNSTGTDISCAPRQARSRQLHRAGMLLRLQLMRWAWERTKRRSWKASAT